MPFAVHPHLRGDHCPYFQIARPGIGSSPPAWGPPNLAGNVRVVRRFIPTCVGTTFPAPVSASRSAVHPHLRGDHVGYSTAIDTCYGSSPPAWGPLPHAVSNGRCPRFIPTCVGTTCPLCQQTHASSVHPHLRGDHPVLLSFFFGYNGSSPPAWGPLRLKTCPDMCRRFIPTCVGTTQARIAELEAAAVHPHLRGDHSV